MVGVLAHLFKLFSESKSMLLSSSLIWTGKKKSLKKQSTFSKTNYTKYEKSRAQSKYSQRKIFFETIVLQKIKGIVEKTIENYNFSMPTFHSCYRIVDSNLITFLQYLKNMSKFFFKNHEFIVKMLKTKMEYVANLQNFFFAVHKKIS